LANTDSYGNIYFPAGIAAGSYPITVNTPTHVLVAGVGGLISKVATNLLISNTDVTSVFGRQGAITALPGDYDTDMVKEKTNLYFSNARARAALSVTTVGSTGPATYNALTGVINIPQYQNEFNGVSSFNTRTGAVTLTALDVTTALTYTPIAVETDPIWAAQKVLYYTKVQADGLFSLIGHTHSIANVTGLQTALDSKEPSIAAGTTSQYWRGDKTWQNLPVYSLPTASTTVLGGVKVDGTTITIDANGVISGANTYTLPTATATILGGVKIGAGVTITSGVISVSTNYEPPITAGTTAQYWRGDKSWQTLPIYTLAGLGGLALSGGTMTGAIILKEGAANGLKFPNDVFGGSGDTAGMRLIARSGEAMSLEVYLTNDADDWFNISVPSGDGAKVNGNTIWHAGNLTNLNQLTNGPGYITSLSGAVLTTYNTSLNSDTRNSRGVTRLYRRDDDSDYSVQTYWTGSHWFIRGYNGDTFHAEARVGYSDSTGSVAWTNVSGRPTALSQFSNDLGNYGNWVVRTGDTMTGTLTVNTSASTNDVALFYSVEPHVDITAAGASNTAALRLFPTDGYNALIGQFRSSGRLVLVASNTEAVFVDKSAMTIGTGSALNSELILYSSNFGNGYATKLQGRNSDGKLWFQYRENSTTWTDVISIGSAGVTATAYFEFSDVRFKNVLETNPSVSIEGIDVIKFTRKGDTQIRYGYSAQQIKKILPDAVEGTDKLVVNYVDVHTLKIAALEKRIAELEAKLNKI